ncbi:MAG: TlpA disulfide reductase family protein [Planctomycetota bacterium]
MGISNFKLVRIANMLLALTCVWSAPAQTEIQAPSQPTTQPVLLELGSSAPPITAAAWLNGLPLALQEHDGPRVYVILFWASWSGPSRLALDDYVTLYEKYHHRGVTFIAVTDEQEQNVRDFLDKVKPPVPFRVALDNGDITTQAYCTAAGITFLPYAFVIGPQRTIAWHGHPQQPELVQVVEQLLAGTYDPAAAREGVRRMRNIDQLQAVFREEYAAENWQMALLALDGLLKTKAPPRRLLRYKLSILLGEMEQSAPASQLADELIETYADDARFLNSLAWDIISQSELYERGVGIGLKLAEAAYRASRGQDAGIADTYARALHLVGRLDLAVAVAERAVALAPPSQQPRYQRMLLFYQQCLELQSRQRKGPS